VYVCIYVCIYVCTYVCMYVWSVDDVANLMPLFCFMFIKGEQLLSAASVRLRYRDMASMRLLLEEDPNLVRYKGLVSRSEYHSAILSYSPCCIIYYSNVSIYYNCHVLITCTHTYIHCIFPALLHNCYDTSSRNPVFLANLT
jgi:hypothetical protein